MQKIKKQNIISLNKDQVFLDEVWKNYLRVKSGNLSTTGQGDKEQKVKDGVWRVSGYSSSGPDHHITEKPFDKHHSNAIGRYKISEGKDDKGHFIQYYDKFDQGTGSGTITTSIYDFVGGVINARKPFEIYDRIYYNPQTMERTYKEDFKEGGYILEEFEEGGGDKKKSPSDAYKKNLIDLLERDGVLPLDLVYGNKELGIPKMGTLEGLKNIPEIKDYFFDPSGDMMNSYIEQRGNPEEREAATKAKRENYLSNVARTEEEEQAYQEQKSEKQSIADAEAREEECNDPASECYKARMRKQLQVSRDYDDSGTICKRFRFYDR